MHNQINSQIKRIDKQQAFQREATLEKYAAATAARTAFMRSDAARFIKQRDWRRQLHEMVTRSRKIRFRKRLIRLYPKKTGHK